MKNKKIEVKGTEIVIYSKDNSDFISLTDIARSADRCGFGRPHYSLRAMILLHTVADLAGGVHSFAGRRRTPHSDGSRDARS